MAAPLRVALTLEQCWHRVPGGTASSILALAAELSRRDDVEVRGVAARHSALPPQPWTPPVPVTGLGLPRALLYETWHYLRWPPVQAVTGPVDVVHATTLAIPPKRGPLVVTVHDLVFRENPQYVTRRGLRFFRRGLALAKSAADLVMVPSRATWAECVDAGFAEDQLRLVPHGVSVPEIPEAKVRDFLARYGLSRPYVLVRDGGAAQEPATAAGGVRAGPPAHTRAGTRPGRPGRVGRGAPRPGTRGADGGIPAGGGSACRVRRRPGVLLSVPAGGVWSAGAGGDGARRPGGDVGRVGDGGIRGRRGAARGPDGRRCAGGRAGQRRG